MAANNMEWQGKKGTVQEYSLRRLNIYTMSFDNTFLVWHRIVSSGFS